MGGKVIIIILSQQTKAQLGAMKSSPSLCVDLLIQILCVMRWQGCSGGGAIGMGCRSQTESISMHWNCLLSILELTWPHKPCLNCVCVLSVLERMWREVDWSGWGSGRGSSASQCKIIASSRSSSWLDCWNCVNIAECQGRWSDEDGLLGTTQVSLGALIPSPPEPRVDLTAQIVASEWRQGCWVN